MLKLESLYGNDAPDASAIAAAVAAGDVRCAEVAAAFLQRIAAAEPKVHAFAAFDAERVRQQAQALDRRAGKGPLAGVPVGIKDMFDTADQPTAFYSPIYTGNQPARDAQVVALLRQAGALVMGKTHTTEFAYMHTGPTRNPHALERTPGSSSAGSAAGMAAGFFALALGTQTAGSLLKPAAYCGVPAFKPSRGLVSLEGVKPLAPSFDTVGWFGRSARDLALLARVLIPGLPQPVSPPGRLGRLALAFYRGPLWQQVEPELAQALEAAKARLVAAGHQVSELVLPDAFASVPRDHQIVNDCEAARSLAWEAQAHHPQLSAQTRAMLERAKATTWAQESAAKQRLFHLAPVLAQHLQAYHAVLAPSCGCLAPLGLESTGPSDFIKFWTAFGLPQINLPLPRRAPALPIGLQLVGGFRRDAQLLQVAEQLEPSLSLSSTHKAIP